MERLERKAVEKMTGRDLIRWIQENHAEDMVVHVRNTDGRLIDGEKPEVRVAIVESTAGQLRTDRYIML